jgi:hypothetical protein
MALNSITKKSNQNRDIKYLNKDFASFRENLIEYAKTYFPKSYSDFNEASPGMMFIEMASYLGDVLSYYIDDSLKESMMLYAEDKENVIGLSQYLGYKAKVTTPALVTISTYQLVPAIGSGDNNVPDSRYYLRIKEGMLVASNTNGTLFRTTELLDFNDADGREISVHETDPNISGDPEPTFYLIKKSIKAISGTIKTTEQTFGTPEQYSKINIGDTNVIQIYDIRDSNSNKWYEVPYLAQEMVYIDYPVSEQTDQDLLPYKDSVSNILKVLKTSRRFVSKTNADNTTTIVFGGGNSTDADETLIPNFKNVGLGLQSSIDRLGESFDPANFLKTRSYGQAPSSTTLTVSYLVGGGIESNVNKGELTVIQRIEFDEDQTVFTPRQLSLYNRMKSTVAVENEEPARGGRGAETIEEIRENSLANFSSQNRAVTGKDYQVRILSLPPKYGGVAKAFVGPYGKEDNRSFAINAYILGYDSDKKVATLNQAVKENVKTYLNEHRMLTDGVNLIDGFVINIGVDFEIRVFGGYNKREVLVNCINGITEHFNIDNWTFNMPINISELELIIAGVEGVSSVPKVELSNKCLGAYSRHSYNLTEATRGKMVYPSLDPSIFEVKYPSKDIKGRVI